LISGLAARGSKRQTIKGGAAISHREITRQQIGGPQWEHGKALVRPDETFGDGRRCPVASGTDDDVRFARKRAVELDRKIVISPIHIRLEAGISECLGQGLTRQSKA